MDGPTTELGESEQYAYTSEAADICTIDEDGRNHLRLTKEPGGDHYPVWSPDGSQIAYTRRDGIYIMNADGRNPRQLISYPSKISYMGEVDKVAWSPDGKHLLFSACLGESLDRDIYLVDVNNGILTNLTSDNKRQDIDQKWTLNGDQIVYLSFDLPVGSCFKEYAPANLKVMNVDGVDQQVIYDREVFYETISVSNNGQVAFTFFQTSTTSVDRLLYTISLDKEEPASSLQSNPGSFSWSPNGKYLAIEGFGAIKLWDAENGKVRELPLRDLDISTAIEHIDGWSPDNQRFTVTTYEERAGAGFLADHHVYIVNIQDGSIRPLIQ